MIRPYLLAHPRLRRTIHRAALILAFVPCCMLEIALLIRGSVEWTWFEFRREWRDGPGVERGA